MASVAAKESERQYRVARQTLSIHGFLRDGFAFKSKAAEIVLLVCSVIFCATTFAGDDFYSTLGFSPSVARIILGIASVTAFALSLALLVVNWKEQWAQHKDAANQWARVVEKFRNLRADDGSWPEAVREELNSAYWEAARTTTVIPDGQFNRLKRRYLRKVATSELSSIYPGAPRMLLGLLLFVRHSAGALREIGEAKSDN